jgi:hypothetical protein
VPQTPDIDPAAEAAREKRARGNLYALEIVFLGFIGVVVVIAFLEALTYSFVSARAPFVIMVPLLLLIAIHALRLWSARTEFSPGARIAEALSGATPGFNKALGFSGWMVVLVVLIAVLGHVAATFVFCVIVMRFLGSETWALTLSVSAGTTLFLFGIFEYAFDIDLYQGLVVRYFLGFRDF